MSRSVRRPIAAVLFEYAIRRVLGPVLDMFIALNQAEKRGREPVSPYVVTTKRPVGGSTVRVTDWRLAHYAVATREQARAVVEAVAIGTQGYMAWDEPNMGPITESGGTVGPLPDGTVIQVRRVNQRELYLEANEAGANLPAIEWLADGRLPALIDAYNARQS